MKRSTLKRKTPMRRAPFRHYDPPKNVCPLIVYPHDRVDRDVLVVETGRTDTRTIALEPPVHDRVPRKAIVNARRNKKTTSYSRRERGWDYMEWVKGLPCLLAAGGGCAGMIEADHAGDRGLGQKSKDAECIPLCSRHHRDRTDRQGMFGSFDAQNMRDWRLGMVVFVQAAAVRAGVAVPEC